MLLTLQTRQAQEFIELTAKVEGAVARADVKEGIAIVFVPHTTAGITINENGDPDVVRDILTTFNRVYPVDGDYHHFEGNSHAHIKTSLVGSSCTIPIAQGRLQLGTWQGIYFCEFDGPRNRKVQIKIIAG